VIEIHFADSELRPYIKKQRINLNLTKKLKEHTHQSKGPQPAGGLWDRMRRRGHQLIRRCSVCERLGYWRNRWGEPRFVLLVRCIEGSSRKWCRRIRAGSE
jgi:hypothetical protein